MTTGMNDNGVVYYQG